MTELQEQILRSCYEGYRQIQKQNIENFYGYSSQHNNNNNNNNNSNDNTNSLSYNAARACNAISSYMYYNMK